ncbi:aquaporin-9 [Callorhinchus milii]|uniref:Aquaporin 9 n=1 Tax=Callorhinchus milii TaxID=7868 RepID=A0A4W3KAJ1_CALMI|nr:aquaporin-9 [Callorhinchus milii]|eukprot:gi/632938356/ref/XP_007904652.1/ PREDICTED: aquaporin-9 [Callorhinchus milii]
MEKQKTSWKEKCKLKNGLLKEGLAECFGTFILILFGCSSNAQTVLSRGVNGNIITSSVGFSFGITIAAYATIGVSGAHLNPAISLSMCVLGQLQWLKFPIYCIAQFVGAFVGSAAVFGLYYDAFMAFDGGNLTITGENATAQIFSSYPSPHLSFVNGFADQIVGTAALLFSVLAILDSKNDRVPKGLEPVVIGIIILVLGCSMSFNCGGSINPARDLGPRLFTAVAGWGLEVFSFRDGWWWVPVLAPMIGGVVGTSFYLLIIELHHKESVTEQCAIEPQQSPKKNYELVAIKGNI